MNEHTNISIQNAVKNLQDAAKSSINAGDYDSAERILIQLRNLETLTKNQAPNPAPTQNPDEVTARGLLERAWDLSRGNYPEDWIPEWLDDVKPFLGK